YDHTRFDDGFDGRIKCHGASVLSIYSGFACAVRRLAVVRLGCVDRHGVPDSAGLAALAGATGVHRSCALWRRCRRRAAGFARIAGQFHHAYDGYAAPRSRYARLLVSFRYLFICGFTTNGLVGTHLIAFCGDNGISEIQAAGLLSMMGIFDLIGTTLSGWLTDRFDARKLLGVYYALRGLALFYLPFSGFSGTALVVFSIFYGLDWIATVPPTLKLSNEAFGDRSGPVVFGWIVAGHQVGAAAAAYFGGYMRELQGNYDLAFQIAGMTAIIAACLALLINTRNTRFEPEPQAA